MKKLIQRFKEWRERRYWKARHFRHIRTNVLTDLRWLSVDPVANEIMERYQWITSELFWYSTPVEPIDQFRRRIGLDPHQKKPINGLIAESAEQREQGQAVDWLPYDDQLRFIQRVLESSAPQQDRDDAAVMVRDIRRSVRALYTAPPTLPAVVPDGWHFYTADFSMQASGKSAIGSVLLIRDLDGQKAWHALSYEDRERIALYVSGKGNSVLDAIADASRKAMLSAAPQPAAQTQESKSAA